MRLHQCLVEHKQWNKENVGLGCLTHTLVCKIESC